ncbi:MAG TPA: ATP-dependent sacrificial sulfur transferase LarE, partial [Candidatus Kapabacteria bacterium]|nr:ATP-dependent sacrificial sulfur transferase LarE [Candidatus Kapabacteria bacterium]
MPQASLIELPIAEPAFDPSLLEVKERSLLGALRSLGSVVIGFSGGVDSTLLLACAKEALGSDKVMAVIGISETYPERELQEAMRLADLIGIPYRTVRTEETDVLKFQENPPDRCYYCKTELFSKLEPIRDSLGFSHVIDGTNLDDLGEFRPGTRARTEQEVLSPLANANLTKSEIRELSRRRGLPTSEKPSYACLSSRFPYHTSIDKAKLKRIDAAENLLYDLGFKVVRVRYHDDKTARVEIGVKEFAKLLAEDVRLAVVEGLKSLGFVYITLDLQGFRSGSMN